MYPWSKSKESIDSRALAAREDLPHFEMSYQQVARLCGRPVALGGSLKHRFDRWKTLVSARWANKVVPVRTKCRYIFYTRYRKHLQPRSSSLFCSLFASLRPRASTEFLALPPLSLSLSFLRCVFCRLVVCGLWSKLFVAPMTRTHYWILLMPANIAYSSSHTRKKIVAANIHMWRVREATIFAFIKSNIKHFKLNILQIFSTTATVY
jgi:hypothetical protein